MEKGQVARRPVPFLLTNVRLLCDIMEVQRIASPQNFLSSVLVHFLKFPLYLKQLQLLIRFTLFVQSAF
jgi:hypothetical protein